MAGEKKSGLGTKNPYMDAFLELPIKSEATDRDLVMGMGRAMTQKGYVKEIKMWPGSWGFKYEDKCIYVPELEMSQEQYEYYIFRLGNNPTDGTPLWPAYGQETDQYRFLHELSHAWQDFEVDQEGDGNWYQEAVDGKNDSPMAVLFRNCYRIRAENPGKGLSTWGNVPDYNQIEDGRMEIAVRAWEDVNELITMYLWNPDYFYSYLKYLAGEIPGYRPEGLEQERLVPIGIEDKTQLVAQVESYVLQIRAACLGEN